MCIASFYDIYWYCQGCTLYGRPVPRFASVSDGQEASPQYRGQLRDRAKGRWFYFTSVKLVKHARNSGLLLLVCYDLHYLLATVATVFDVCFFQRPQELQHVPRDMYCNIFYFWIFLAKSCSLLGAVQVSISSHFCLAMLRRWRAQGKRGRAISMQCLRCLQCLAFCWAAWYAIGKPHEQMNSSTAEPTCRWLKM